MPHIEGYADFLVEITREKLGYDADDNSHDDEVLTKLQAGEKLSKSKHMQMGEYIDLDKAKGFTIDRIEEVNDEKIKIHFTNGKYSEVSIGFSPPYSDSPDYFLNY